MGVIVSLIRVFVVLLIGACLLYLATVSFG